jgi:hypothetical protein
MVAAKRSTVIYRKWYFRQFVGVFRGYWDAEIVRGIAQYGVVDKKGRSSSTVQWTPNGQFFP